MRSNTQAAVFTAMISLPMGIAAGPCPGRFPDKLAFYVGSILSRCQTSGARWFWF